MATTMDSLTTLLDQYTLRAGAFFAGNLCGHHGFPDDVGRGHLHVIRSGRVRILGIQTSAIVIDSPTLLFLTRPGAHRLAVDSDAGSDMVCGTVQLGLGGWNPVTSALPDVIVVPLADLRDLDGLLVTLFAEAFGQGIGRQAVLDRCCEIVAVRLMRHCVQNGIARGGTLAGLSHPRLAVVLQAIHQQPDAVWTLARMADLAHMSRSRLALLFRQVTGDAPMSYVAAWRITTAQRLLRKGSPIKQVAGDVGFATVSAFSKAFARLAGVPPSLWVAQLHNPSQPHNGTIGQPTAQADP
ncbi:MAG: AraC family transcriptional regulator [Betaproteobacteria bacterium HGW-Betaproteobacteria-16]|nr:MAG: AraC family transcriptional regulator [Betaproteobacteria bacterium HGW-Betaproteobacteria-16]